MSRIRRGEPETSVTGVLGDVVAEEAEGSVFGGGAGFIYQRREASEDVCDESVQR